MDFQQPGVNAPPPQFSSPLGDFPELQAIYGSKFQSDVAGASANALANQSSIAASNSREAAAMARKRAIAEAQAELDAIDAKNDPKNYTKVRNKDGGFDFFDPTGERITVAQYAQVTGDRPTDVLKESDNFYDRKFVEHYNLATDLLRSQVTGDKNEQDKIKKKYPDLYEQVQNMTPRDIANDLYTAYPEYMNYLINTDIPELQQQQQGGGGIGGKIVNFGKSLLGF